MDELGKVVRGLETACVVSGGGDMDKLCGIEDAKPNAAVPRASCGIRANAGTPGADWGA